jgi:hypothetical protein
MAYGSGSDVLHPLATDAVVDPHHLYLDAGPYLGRATSSTADSVDGFNARRGNDSARSHEREHHLQGERPGGPLRSQAKTTQGGRGEDEGDHRPEAGLAEEPRKLGEREGQPAP